jgi:hypothetical protein
MNLQCGYSPPVLATYLPIERWTECPLSYCWIYLEPLGFPTYPDWMLSVILTMDHKTHYLDALSDCWQETTFLSCNIPRN